MSVYADPGDDGYVQRLLGAFERHGDRSALIYDGETVTYREAMRTVYRYARSLSELGLRRGDGVAALAANTPRIVLVQLAAQLLGCYFAGIEGASVTEQARMLEVSRSSVLVFDPLVHEAQAIELARRAEVRELLSLGVSTAGTDLVALAERVSADPLAPQGADSDVAELVFTGGSSGGKPKAASFSFGRRAALIRYWTDIASAEGNPDYPLLSDADARLLRCAPFVSVPGLNAVPVLLNGGAIYLDNGFDPVEVLRSIETDGITVLALYPAQLCRLLDCPNLDDTDTSGLRLITYYGAPIATGRLVEAIDRFGPVLLKSYGQSETGMISALYQNEHTREQGDRLRSVGRPRSEVEVQIEQDDMHPGNIGEIRVRAPYMMDGYWMEDQLSRQTIVDGWISTGDLGYRDADGYLHIVDRLRDMVIVNGTNCYTADVEDVLAGHPAVGQAVAVGLPDSETGEAVHAAVVLKSPAAAMVDTDELRAFVLVRKSALHVPKTIAVLDEVPMTRRGKPDKNAVRALLIARAAESGQ